MRPIVAVALLSGLVGCQGIVTKGDERGGAVTTALRGAGTVVVGLAGKCLDDSGGGTADGNKIQLWDCNGTDAQSWSSTNGQLVGPGGKCLDVEGDNQADGTVVQLHSCNGTAAQQWTMRGNTIVSAGGFCLDVTSSGTANGTQIEIWSCNGGSNQQWSTTGGGGGGSQLPLTGPTGTWSYTSYGGMGFYYLLPDGFDPNSRYPLVTYLHQWGGEVSLTGIDQIDSFFNNGPFKSSYRAVVLAPQCEGSNIDDRSWGGITSSGQSTCEGQALAIIDAVASNSWAGDKFLTGYSLGAIGTWHIVLTHPGDFARAMSVSGSIGCGTRGCDWNAVGYTPDSAASILSSQSTYLSAVHGDADGTVSISWDQDVAQLNPANYAFISIAGGDHGIFGSIYTDSHYLQMLMGY